MAGKQLGRSWAVSRIQSDGQRIWKGDLGTGEFGARAGWLEVQKLLWTIEEKFKAAVRGEAVECSFFRNETVHLSSDGMHHLYQREGHDKINIPYNRDEGEEKMETSLYAGDQV